jgi:predicted enzyme related to lactoylglutathione lyase
MLNFQVDDLEGVLERVSAAGASVDPKREDYDYGRFGWFMDPSVRLRSHAFDRRRFGAEIRASV